MSAKDEVMKMIERKKNKNYKSRKKILEETGIDKIVATFLREVNAIPQKSWAFEIQTILDKFHNIMRVLDPDVTISLSWCAYDKEKDSLKPEDSYLDGVQIVWSDTFLEKNKNANKELFIDISSVFIQDLL
jgi:hypothetical protein